MKLISFILWVVERSKLKVRDKNLSIKKGKTCLILPKKNLNGILATFF